MRTQTKPRAGDFYERRKRAHRIFLARLHAQTGRLHAKTDLGTGAVAFSFWRGQYQLRAGRAHQVFETVAEIVDLLDDAIDLISAEVRRRQDLYVLRPGAQSHRRTAAAHS